MGLQPQENRKPPANSHCPTWSPESWPHSLSSLWSPVSVSHGLKPAEVRSKGTCCCNVFWPVSWPKSREWRTGREAKHISRRGHILISHRNPYSLPCLRGLLALIAPASWSSAHVRAFSWHPPVSFCISHFSWFEGVTSPTESWFLELEVLSPCCCIQVLGPQPPVNCCRLSMQPSLPQDFAIWNNNLSPFELIQHGKLDSGIEYQINHEILDPFKVAQTASVWCSS